MSSMQVWFLAFLIAGFSTGCGKSKTMKGSEVGGAAARLLPLRDQGQRVQARQPTGDGRHDLVRGVDFTPRQDASRSASEASASGMHPMLSDRWAATMHEDSFATDVSNQPGPLPNEAKVEYFHVLEKGTKLSGMSPFYTFLDDHTVVTISFGRDSAMLLIVDISGDARVLDYVALPGRGSKALELAKKSARMAMFRDTSGGAYSYLDLKGNVYVPGADNTVIRIPIRDRRVVRDEMVLLDLEPRNQSGELDRRRDEAPGKPPDGAHARRRGTRLVHLQVRRRGDRSS